MLEAASAMIELDALSKRYGDFTALGGLNLRVRRGEIFALLGPNGAGKTTTMRILMGFLKATAGSARIAGLDCFEGGATQGLDVGHGDVFNVCAALEWQVGVEQQPQDFANFGG